MGPTNPVFSHDYPKFVYQTPDVVIINENMPKPKPFAVKGPEKSEKSKKNLPKPHQLLSKKNDQEDDKKQDKEDDNDTPTDTDLEIGVTLTKPPKNIIPRSEKN